MSRKTFCISFFLRKACTNKAGLTPILARITTNGISKEIDIQCSVPADKWNQSKERALARTSYVSRSILIWTTTAQGFSLCVRN